MLKPNYKRISVKQGLIFLIFREDANVFFLLAGHKVDFISPCGTNKSTFWPASRKKNRVQHGKNIYFTRVVVTLALLGH